MLFHEQVGQHLCGLAQAHVVGQDAGQVVFAQVLQPGHAMQLVRAQLQLQAHGIEGLGLQGRWGACALKAIYQLAQALVALQLPLAMGAGTLRGRVGQTLTQGLQAVGFPGGELQRAFAVGTALGVGEQVDHGP